MPYNFIGDSKVENLLFGTKISKLGGNVILLFPVPVEANII